MAGECGRAAKKEEEREREQKTLPMDVEKQSGQPWMSPDLPHGLWGRAGTLSPDRSQPQSCLATSSKCVLVGLACRLEPLCFRLKWGTSPKSLCCWEH